MRFQSKDRGQVGYDFDAVAGEATGFPAMGLAQIEIASTLTRAYSSVSSAQVPRQEIADPALGKAKKANARVIKAVDAAAFRRCLKDSLR